MFFFAVNQVTINAFNGKREYIQLHFSNTFANTVLILDNLASALADCTPIFDKAFTVKQKTV